MKTLLDTRRLLAGVGAIAASTVLLTPYDFASAAASVLGFIPV